MDDWRPSHLKKPPLLDADIDLLQLGLDVYRSNYEGYDPHMDRQNWQPVADLIRKLEQLRVGH